MPRGKSLYRRPLICLGLYLAAMASLLAFPLPLWARLAAALPLSGLIYWVWLHNFRHLTAHREELRTVANTVEDPMWSLQPNGTVEWMNPAFLALFNVGEDQRYRHYSAVIAAPPVLEFIRDFLLNREQRMTEIAAGDHYYLITGSFNREAERFVFIMQNIDLIRQTEKMKRDFMVNVAHELRTPLTAIKGFTLALEEDFSPANRRFLKIIKNHTERLIRLISDLQTLARLERLPDLDVQTINLRTFMDNIVDMYRHTVEEEGLYLRYSQRPDHISAEVDPFKFEQIFVNLIDNALRYTSSGGIDIAASAEGGELRITLQDSGAGIPAEHLPRIFERFYVADYSRNKKVSGTGLGLAIVKHAVRLHRGSIEVESGPGRGTRFTLKFPLEGPNG